MITQLFFNSDETTLEAIENPLFLAEQPFIICTKPDKNELIMGELMVGKNRLMFAEFLKDTEFKGETLNLFSYDTLKKLKYDFKIFLTLFQPKFVMLYDNKDSKILAKNCPKILKTCKIKFDFFISMKNIRTHGSKMHPRYLEQIQNFRRLDK